MRTKIIVTTLAATTLAASSAYASGFDVYGAGARGAAMGAQVGAPEGVYSIYYNVGGLSKAEPGVTIGATVNSVNAEILLAPRPSGYDIPNLGADTPTLPSDETINPRADTREPKPSFSLTFGGVTSFGIDGFRAGILVNLPTENAFSLTTRHPDETERLFSNQLQFEFLGQSTRRLDLEAGIAYQATEWLSFGIGGTYVPSTSLVTNVFLPDAANQSQTLTTTHITTESDWGLLAGVVVDLPYAISLGLSYRGPVAFEIGGESRIQLIGLDPDEERPVQTIDWTPTSSPGIAALGASWKVGTFVLNGDLKYTLWSAYRGTQSESTNFSNTFSGFLGTEYLYSPTSRIRFGTGFVPSPVPEQTGRTNYVDNSRISLSTGSAHKFLVAEIPFEVSWYFQVQLLVSRRVEKAQHGTYSNCEGASNSTICDEVPDDLVDPSTGQPYTQAQGLQTGNPGFPGYSHGGWLGSLGIEVKL